MKKAEIKLAFDADKLAAIKQYMNKKDKDILSELEDVVAKLYDKYVPLNVKEFIDYNEQSGNEPSDCTHRRNKHGAEPPGDGYAGDEIN
jgi:hypothetical protein